MGEWGGHCFLKVSRFREKLSIDLAREFVDSAVLECWDVRLHRWGLGRHFDAFCREPPRPLSASLRIQTHSRKSGGTDAMSIDYGVMERSNAILTVRCDLGWRDREPGHLRVRPCPGMGWTWRRWAGDRQGRFELRRVCTRKGRGAHRCRGPRGGRHRRRVVGHAGIGRQAWVRSFAISSHKDKTDSPDADRADHWTTGRMAASRSSCWVEAGVWSAR